MTENQEEGMEFDGSSLGGEVEIEEIPSPSGSQEHSTLSKDRKHAGGRTKSSYVWQFYDDLDAAGSKAKAKCKICGMKLTRYPETLKRHLAVVHDDQKSIFEEAKKKAEKALELKHPFHRSETQTSLEASFKLAAAKKSEKYSAEHKKQKQFNEDVALFVAGSSMPRSGIQSVLFQRMIFNVDSKLTVPSQKVLQGTTVKLCNTICEAVKEVMKNACRVTICVDLWSRKALSASVVGTTVHFYDRSRKRICHAVLKLQPLDYPHRAERIIEAVNKILETWGFEGGLDDCKVFKIVTDSGSNVVKAFRNTIELIRILQESDPTEDVQEVLDANLEQEGPDVEPDESREEMIEDLISRDKRLSCVDHKLANLVKNTIEKNEAARELVDSAQRLVGKLKSSGKASEAFATMGTGRKLVCPVKTRWIFNYYVLDRLIDLEDIVHHVCTHVVDVVNNLSTLEWKQAKALRDLLFPFEIYVRELEGENYVTASRVIPALLDIKKRLSSLSQTLAFFSELAKNLLREVDIQFGYILDSRHVKFNHFYAMATFLDPNFSMFLNLQSARDLKSVAEKETAMYLKHLNRGKPDEPQAQAITENSSENVEDQLFGLLEQELSDLQKVVPGKAIAAEEDEVKRYTDSLEHFMAKQKKAQQQGQQKETAHEFWEKQQKELPLLYDLAVDVLTVPATSAPVERVFSQAGLCDDPKRRSLALANLEREVSIPVNSSYLEQ